jgi:hypothetical protein
MVVFLSCMRKLLFAFLIMSIVFVSGCRTPMPKGCTTEAKVCPDGSSVGRTGLNCEFEACPPYTPPDITPSDNIYCDANTRCPGSMECYKFQDSNSPYCYSGDPCIKCGTGKKCIILESYPAQISCQ